LKSEQQKEEKKTTRVAIKTLFAVAAPTAALSEYRMLLGGQL
jgi:hypothetical protein